MRYYVCLLILLSLAACKKEEIDKDHYFFCTVNGEYINLDPHRKFSYATIPSGAPSAYLDHNKKTMVISASDEDGHGISIRIDDTAKEIISANYNVSNNLGSAYISFRSKGDDYSVDSTNTGMFNLKMFKEYITGTFACDLKHKKTGEIIHITDGAFRLTYRAY